MMNDLGLYIHIPFCLRKCRYCDFLSFDDKAFLTGRYIDRLKAEIADRAEEYSGFKVKSIYIGGGTPSILNAGVIRDLMDHVYKFFDVTDEAEISIEVNPGSVDEQKLHEYRRSGINRLSIGLQSARDDELAVLGRIHSWKDFCRTYELARDNGFDNINIDLISAIPGQSTDSYAESLQKIISLEPEHISAYSLQLEEGTYFYEHRDEYEWPDEDTDRDMYHQSAALLGEAGYDRYEISNYSKPGYECRHNIIYWCGDDYLGVGIGAASYMEGIRFRNTDSIEEYLKGIRCTERNVLSETDRIEEFMFLGLRMTSGISASDFCGRFGKSVFDIYGHILETCKKDGLIMIKDDIIRLTEFGLDVSNYVFAKFLLNDR
ncbi:MAG: radical SAM family heme chaperone HemW [Lachnospiraceae bacterium]|nr:radical SAM family heme chaperone HemW [Lachnospiraceae bacterium]